MSVARIAKRYAKSLLDLAVERNQLETVKDSFDTFFTLCKQNRDFVLMLKSPIIPHRKKATILRAVLEKKVDTLSLSFFDLMSKKKRENILDEVAKEFLEQYNERTGIISARLTTCVVLGDRQRNEFASLIDRITGKKSELEESINPDLIGGFLVRFKDKQIDETIKGKLKKIRLKFNQ